MKYFQALILLFLTIFSLSCQKKPRTAFDSYSSFSSSITGTFNGRTWKKDNWTLLGIFKDLNPSTYYNYADTANSLYCEIDGDRFTLTLSQFNEQEILRETLFILGLSKKKGRFAVIPRIYPSCDIKDSLNVDFSTSTADGDVVKDIYAKVDEKHANNVEITDYKSKQVKGTFDIKLIMTRRRDERNAIYPDTLHLKGTFDIKK